ncbi:MAG: hypothetical protein IT323_01330, partial [Anaerolineae bacterium]|nr:hypothetical protein [Anaerolineae bacterium]
RVGVMPEEGLAAVISADVSQQPGALPLLQYALTELFERREAGQLTLRAYQEMKGVHGALARRAEEVYTQLGQGGQQAAKQTFLRLVTLGEGVEDTRRRVPLAELQGLGDADTVQGVLDAFDRARLLTFDRDSGASGPTVELAHEAILREWSGLREWLDESRTDVRLERLLNASTADWLAAGREASYLLHGGRLAMYRAWKYSTSIALTSDEAAYVDASIRHEQRQAVLRRRLRRLAFGVAVTVAVVMSALAVLARIGQVQAERQAAVNRSLVLASAAEDTNAAGQVDLALLLALEAVRIPEPPYEAVVTLRNLAFDMGARAALRPQGNEIRAVAFSADGARALSGGCARALGSACLESELLEWRLDGSAETRYAGEHSGWVTGVAFSPDGRLVLSGDANGLAVLWDAATQRPRYRLEGHRGAISQALFSPDGLKALTAAADGSLTVWDVRTGQALHRLEWHNAPVTACAFSPDGQIIASGAQDGLILVWDVNTGGVINRLRGHAAAITGLAFRSPGNAQRTLLSSSLDGSIREWDTGQEVQLHQGALILSPLGLAVLPGQSDILFYTRFWVGLYDPDRTVMKRLAYSPWGAVSAVAVSPDGRRLLIGHSGGALTLENLAVTDLVQHYQADAPVIWTDLSPDGRFLLAGSMSGGAAIVWDLATGGEVWRLNGLENIVTGGFSPDGKQMLIASSDWLAGTANVDYALVDAATGRTLHTLVGHEYAYRSHVFDHDGGTLYTGSFAWGAGFADKEGQGELIAWDVATGALVRRFDVSAAVPGMALSPDGSLLMATAMTFGPMKLLDTATGKVIREFSDLRNMPGDEAAAGVPAGGYAVIWGPDERTVIYGSVSGDLVQLDVESGEALRVFHGHDKPAFGLALSPDGRYLLSGDAGSPGQVILWDYASGQELRRFLGHSAPVVRVLFSPDGRSAFSAGYDGVILQWRIDELTLDELLTWVNANRYVRPLTCEERRYYNIPPLCTPGAR